MFDKEGGVQVGIQVFIKLLDEEQNEREIVYYTKTHHGGARNEDDSESQRVDLKELLIYNILRLSRFGPEFHFFYDDIKDFYIATKDEGYDDRTMTQKQFVTYEALKSRIDLSQLAVNEIVVESAIIADIFSRVLLLSDVTNNSANMGWVIKGDDKL